MPRRVVPNPPTPPKGNPGSPDSYLVAQQKKLVPANSRAATPPKYRGEVAHVGADSLLIAHSKKVADAKQAARAPSPAKGQAAHMGADSLLIAHSRKQGAMSHRVRGGRRGVTPKNGAVSANGVAKETPRAAASPAGTATPTSAKGKSSPPAPPKSAEKSWFSSSPAAAAPAATKPTPPKKQPTSSWFSAAPAAAPAAAPSPAPRKSLKKQKSSAAMAYEAAAAAASPPSAPPSSSTLYATAAITASAPGDAAGEEGFFSRMSKWFFGGEENGEGEGKGGGGDFLSRLDAAERRDEAAGASGLVMRGKTDPGDAVSVKLAIGDTGTIKIHVNPAAGEAELDAAAARIQGASVVAIGKDAEDPKAAFASKEKLRRTEKEVTKAPPPPPGGPPAAAAAAPARKLSVSKAGGGATAEEKLAALFASVDVNKDGAVSRTELKAKLAADEELQALLKAAGLNPQFYVFEQLDSDGDAKITLAEVMTPPPIATTTSTTTSHPLHLHRHSSPTDSKTPTSRRPPRPSSRPR